MKPCITGDPCSLMSWSSNPIKTPTSCLTKMDHPGQNRSFESDAPSEMSLKYMASGNFPVVRWDFVVDFIAEYIFLFAMKLGLEIEFYI